MAPPERERACGGLPGRLPGVDGRPDVGGHAALRQLRRSPPRAQGTRTGHRRRVGPKGEFLRVLSPLTIFYFTKLRTLSFSETFITSS